MSRCKGFIPLMLDRKKILSCKYYLQVIFLLAASSIANKDTYGQNELDSHDGLLYVSGKLPTHPSPNTASLRVAEM